MTLWQLLMPSSHAIVNATIGLNNKMKYRDHCFYCKKPQTWANDDDDLIVFCNEDCLANYVFVQIFKAKQLAREEGLI